MSSGRLTRMLPIDVLLRCSHQQTMRRLSQRNWRTTATSPHLHYILENFHMHERSFLLFRSRQRTTRQPPRSSWRSTSIHQTAYFVSLPRKLARETAILEIFCCQPSADDEATVAEQLA